MENDPRSPKRFPVFHVPHDGGLFPQELMASVCIPEARFLYYHERMRDVGALEMVPALWRSRENVLFFPISRLLCDVERFPGPEEPMERLGMGFCYERAYDGTRIKRVTDELKAKTLLCYQTHHRRLDRLCAEHSRLLLLDLHSFSEELVPRGQLRCGESMHDVYLGGDGRFTPSELAASAEAVLRSAGFSMARNYPYSGSLVPGAVLRGTVRCDCASIMLEWNKRVYCNAQGRPAAASLARIREIVRRIADLSSDLT
jgi:N-formylglutamate amidohydrolase